MNPQIIRKLLNKLCRQPKIIFPKQNGRIEAPSTQGVYIIRRNNDVLHVGRTLRGKGGLHQRLANHLHGSSSFTKTFFKGNGDKLRGRCTFQYLEVPDEGKRAYVEALAIGTLCPKHIGTGA